MFSHVMLGMNDVEATKKFYDATMAVLGYGEGVIDPKGRLFYFDKRGTFGLSIPIDGKPACAANGGTIGFAVDSAEMAEAWHEAGLANGGTAIEDPPGIREGGSMKMHLAYLRDPSGNKICTLLRMG
ncbi:glyoxalase [Sphingorhabdus lutea]|uniref:Glyoxalase n=1 Tax=Sphingorhabdus lutea TaxID=1913578 RepID=A0A1L3JB17_9SPHN|nr:VOC family protein [Sphingorhabdus lutea]APG62330.1 glyoxalase [Sphingorhabdus lutea]